MDLRTILCTHHRRNVDKDNTTTLNAVHYQLLPTRRTSQLAATASTYKSRLTTPFMSSIPAPAKLRYASCQLDPELYRPSSQRPMTFQVCRGYDRIALR